jgi:hypothetical protein
MPAIRTLLCAWSIVGAALLAALPGAADAQAAKAGWWIRVDTKKTEATGIVLQLGTSKADRRDWRTWRGNDPAEFDLPAEFVQLPQIHLRVAALPDDEDVWFCLFYQGQGVRHFDFDTVEEVTLKQSDRDRECR